jgi:ABC-type phosphate/phosphonate transport system substrate-binding protein
MIASLGMYDPRWLHPANDRLWRAIAHRLRATGLADVPEALCRDRAPGAIWTAPDLLLAQTCGYPLATQLGHAVTVVATPVYRAPGCDGAWHRSALVVRRADPARDLPALAGRRAAINARDSNTGMNLLRAAVAPHARDGRFFASVVETGAHARSIWAVIAGKADLAAIDAVTLALLRDRYPRLDRRIRVLGWTMATPGLPLITSARHSSKTVAALRAALAQSIADPELAPARAALRLVDWLVLPRSAYDAVLALETQAHAAGYRQVC